MFGRVPSHLEHSFRLNKIQSTRVKNTGRFFLQKTIDKFLFSDIIGSRNLLIFEQKSKFIEVLNHVKSQEKRKTKSRK